MPVALLSVLLALRIITLPMLVSDMAVSAGVSPRLAACVVGYESNWNANEISTSNAQGLWQIKPETAAWAAGKLGMAHWDLLDPIDNTTLGLYILQTFPEWYLVIDICTGD